MSTRSIVYISLFTSLTCALGLLPSLALPFVGVPITVQSIACMLAGAIAGSKRGSLAMMLFTVLIIIGFPLLAGGRGGIGVLFGPTGGFLLSWIIGAYVTGWLYEKNLNRLNLLLEVIFISIGGIVSVYTIGIPWLSIAASITLKQAFISCLAFIPGDFIKVFLAVHIVRAIRKGYPTLYATNE